MKYRVRRDLNGNTYTQLKSADLPECRRVLQSLKAKWDDLANTPLDDQEPFVAAIAGMKLVVRQGERIVDSYVIERC